MHQDPGIIPQQGEKIGRLHQECVHLDQACVVHLSCREHLLRRGNYADLPTRSGGVKTQQFALSSVFVGIFLHRMYVGTIARASTKHVFLRAESEQTSVRQLHVNKLSLRDRLIAAELLASREHASIHHRPRPLKPDAPSAMYARQVTAWVCLGSQR